MKRHSFALLGAIFFFTLAFFNITNLNAGIYFITKPDNITSQNQGKSCFILGYKKTSADCAKLGLKLTDTCSYDNRYGKSCSCDNKTFQYDTSNCKTPKKLGGNFCENKYETCDCDSNVYKFFVNSDCSKDKVIDTKESCKYSNDRTGYSKCSCASQFSETCTGNLEGIGDPCDGKYIACKCKSNFKICSNNKGDAGSSSCVDTEGTKFTSCQPENCPSGTVDSNTYWGGNLKYFIPIPTGNIVSGKNCITLPSCDSLGFSRTCNTSYKLTCPFDSSKTYCLD